MEAKQVKDLMEAYASVYQENEEVEQLDEFLGSGAAQVVDSTIKKVQTGLEKIGVPINRTPRGTVTKAQQEKTIGQNVAKEEVEVEEVDEAMSSYDRNRLRAAKRAEERNEARRRGQTGNVPGVGYVSPRPERTTWTDESGQQRHHTGARMPKKEDQKESFDLFDVILEHLVAEGYADTNKAALAIMANMSEEWKQSIVEATYGDADPTATAADKRMTVTAADKKANTPAWQKFQAGNPAYVAAPHLKGV